MIKIKPFILSCLLLLGGAYSPSGSISDYGVPSTDFLSMEGIKSTHILENSKDSLSDKKVIELQERNGLTNWFGRFFHMDICTTGICRMVKVWIFWDGAGNYLGMQFDENDPLTKSDHTPFDPEDYVRMDEIMADTASILKDLSYDDLTVELPDEEKEVSLTTMGLFEVDGYSSATVPSLKEYVVEDAVFTCYTLWHTVYGETKEYIDSLLLERISPEYIDRLLSGNSKQQLFALEHIKYQDTWSDRFETEVLQLISSSDMEVAGKALSLIGPDYLASEAKQTDFVACIKGALPEIKYEILYTLQAIKKVSPETILLLLDLFQTGDISQGALNHMLKIIENEAAATESIKENMLIRERLEQLIVNSDPYTSNLVKNFTRKIQW